jgi:hypothetical protein
MMGKWRDGGGERKRDKSEVEGKARRGEGRDGWKDERGSWPRMESNW